MCSMVRDQLLRDNKSSDSMIKKEAGHNASQVIEYQHSFRPFGKVVNGHNGVAMTTS